MNKFILLVVFLVVSGSSIASRCGASVVVINDSEVRKTLEACLEYEKQLQECKYPMSFEIEAGKKKKISLVYMCGYDVDIDLKEYWVLYAISGSGDKKYKKFKYGKGQILVK